MSLSEIICFVLLNVILEYDYPTHKNLGRAHFVLFKPAFESTKYDMSHDTNNT